VGSGIRKTFGPEEAALSKWMMDNAGVAWIEVDFPWEVESYLLKKLNLPLNLEGHSHGCFYKELREIRTRSRLRAGQLPILQAY
jgi:hypothetical protein